jgi:hypothetical protein
MVRQVLVSLLALVFVGVGHAYGDVTYSYIAGSTTYSNTSGSTVSVPIYLKESVTTTGSDQTSLINRYFAQGFNNPYQGVSSIGVAVEEMSATDSANRSQILGGPIVTPSGGYPGVSNNAGWTFAPDFTYSFTQVVGSTPTAMTGGSSAARLYQNVNDSGTGVSGNNIQVKAALIGTNSSTNKNNQTGAVTDATYAGNTTTAYGDGKVLIGTLTIQVGNGTTTFLVQPLSKAAFTNPASSTFNTNTNTGANGTGSGVASPLNGSTIDTVLAVDKSVFALNTSNTPIYLDTSYTGTSTQRTGNATYDTYNAINFSFTAATGPDASPVSSSFLPFYTANPAAFQFTVAAVPEPGSIVLCGLAVFAGAGAKARRRWKRRTRASLVG